jgi:drug/metabolite transporter (DMT)-like permease
VTETAEGGVKSPGPVVRGKAVRAYTLLVAFLALRAFGNLALAWGTKHLPQGLSTNPVSYGLAMLNPFVTLAIAMLILALLVRMALLSVADLSFVLPMTAVGYVIAAVFGKLFLHEEVSAQRWLGVLLIFAGAALVGSTSQKTTEEVDGIL